MSTCLPQAPPREKCASQPGWAAWTIFSVFELHCSGFISTDSNVRKRSSGGLKQDCWWRIISCLKAELVFAENPCHLIDDRHCVLLCHGGPGSSTSLQGVRLSPTLHCNILFNTVYTVRLLVHCTVCCRFCTLSHSLVQLYSNTCPAGLYWCIFE